MHLIFIFNYCKLQEEKKAKKENGGNSQFSLIFFQWNIVCMLYVSVWRMRCYTFKQVVKCWFLILKVTSIKTTVIWLLRGGDDGSLQGLGLESSRKTPKLQPTAEEPLRKKDWNPSEKIFYTQRWRGRHSKVVGAVLSQNNKVP